MQFLPSGGKSRFHCHPTACPIEFQQSGLLARGKMTCAEWGHCICERADAMPDRW
jgi:hypothetical protein